MWLFRNIIITLPWYHFLSLSIYCLVYPFCLSSDEILRPTSSLIPCILQTNPLIYVKWLFCEFASSWEPLIHHAIGIVTRWLCTSVQNYRAYRAEGVVYIIQIIKIKILDRSPYASLSGKNRFIEMNTLPREINSRLSSYVDKSSIRLNSLCLNFHFSIILAFV